MEKLIEAFEKCTLLQALPPKLIETYYKEGKFQFKNYGKNEILHFEDDFCNYLEIIISGEVVVERIDESGNLLTVTSFRSGNIIGANLLFSSSPYYPMTVTAKLISKTMIIHKNLAFELCNTYPNFLNQFLKVISDHTIILGTKIKHHINRSIRDGIIYFIKKEYLIQNSLTIVLPITKKALAEHMGVSRTSLSRELQKMKNENLINYDIKSITIVNLSLIG